MNAADAAQPTSTSLQQEVDRLRDEVAKLRGFLDSLSALAQAMESISEDAELHELLSRVLEQTANSVRARDASLLVLDEDTDELVFVLSRGSLAPDALAWRRMPASEGVAGWVATQRRATIVNHAQSDERFYPAIDEETQFHTESLLAAPIIGGGRVLGVIEVLNKVDHGLFNTQDQTMLTLACRLAGEMLFVLTRRTLQAARVQVPRRTAQPLPRHPGG